MPAEPIDPVGLRQDLAAIEQLHRDAAEAVRLRADRDLLRETLRAMVAECNEYRNDDEAGWLACRLLVIALDGGR
jgi:hypothetical protein